MDSDGLVELRFCGTTVERHSQPLDDLARVRPDHVAPQHTVRGLIHDKLHHGRFIPARQCVLERSKGGLVDAYELISLACFLLRQSHRTDIRGAEDRGRNVDVVWLSGIVAEQCLGDRAAFGDGNRGQH